jgi:hypothetical protein
MKMKRWFLLLFLQSVLVVTFAQSRPIAVVRPDGSEVLTTEDSNEVTSATLKLKPLPEAETYIFPVTSPKRKEYAPAQKIFTGVYSSKKREKEESAEGKFKVFNSALNTGENIDEVGKSETKDQSTIAWISKDENFYHSPYLDCGSVTRKIWVKNLEVLAGIEPCPGCFHSTGQAPKFIREECGGLDLAEPDELLDNAGFIEWLTQHLPVKKAVFLTSKKLLIYPNKEMSAKGLEELAHEVAMAYRRHTWKVIEVMTKNSKQSIESYSSF